jgi:hypothetical protein
VNERAVLTMRIRAGGPLRQETANIKPTNPVPGVSRQAKPNAARVGRFDAVGPPDRDVRPFSAQPIVQNRSHRTKVLTDAAARSVLL